MKFEFDPEKSAANKRKHGIDFKKAQLLWKDSALIEIPAKTMGEPRWLVVGMIDNKCWSAVITYREDVIRLISVRRAREEEMDIYENF